jgi:hypothetical protein
MLLNCIVYGQSFRLPIHATDGENNFTIYFGVDPKGTDGYDEGLDLLAPPPPPAGAFDIRLTFSNEDYFRDIRDAENFIKKYQLKYQTAENKNIILYWNPDSLSQYGTFQITDSFGGNYYILDMLGTDSLNTSSIDIIKNKLTIIFTPTYATIINTFNNQKLKDMQIDIWPNPFNSGTMISFNINYSTTLSVNLYNINGQRIRELKNQYFSAGLYTFYLDASNLGNGCYFCGIKSNKEYKVIKIFNIQ